MRWLLLLSVALLCFAFSASVADAAPTYRCPGWKIRYGGHGGSAAQVDHITFKNMPSIYSRPGGCRSIVLLPAAWLRQGGDQDNEGYVRDLTVLLRDWECVVESQTSGLVSTIVCRSGQHQIAFRSRWVETG